MRVAVVNYAYDDREMDPDGLLDRYPSLTGWSNAIHTAGATVAVVQRFDRDAQIVRNGIEFAFRRDGPHGDPRSKLLPWRVHRTTADLEPDVVHVNGLNVPLQIWFLRRSLPGSVSIVAQDHGGTVPRGAGRLRQRARRIAMRSADAFFFTSSAQADPWRREEVVGADQPVFQILEASTEMRPVEREWARLESGVDGDPALLWVGRLNANKSPLTILDAFERVLGRLPAATLTMVYGADDLLPAVRARLERSSALAGSVRLVGSIPKERMPLFYSAADVFVLGSHHEGAGFALIEACACGLPPVVTDIPAFRVITGDGRVGALWPVDDADRCGAAIVTVAGQDREASRRSVSQHFDHALSWAAVGRQAIDAYRRIVELKRAHKRRRTT